MRLDRDTVPERGLDLTPLIDVVFLLLVFFLAATTFADDEVQMELELPQAQNGNEDRQPDRPLVIAVAQDGTLQVDGRQVSIEGLRQKLRAAAARDKDTEVVIRGDTRVHFGAVAQAFDACLGASLTKVAIAADPDRQGG